MSDITSRVATTGQLLVRSGIEIDRLLSGMMKDHAAVSANLPGQLIFLSRLVSVDPVKQRLALAYSDYKAANTALLKAVSIVLKANFRGAKFAFACAQPRAVEHAGQQVIELQAPPMILAAQREKTSLHKPIEKGAPDLRCQLPVGLITLEARLVDMSLDGRAFLLADAASPLCAGTWVRGARITPQGAAPVAVDIELRHVIPTLLPDGERATRIACQIVGTNEALEQIVRRFIIDLE